MKTTEEKLKALQEAVDKSKLQISQLAKSAENIAKDYALKSITGGAQTRDADIELAKDWNSRAGAFAEALRLLP